jgi:hypothetical protein
MIKERKVKKEKRNIPVCPTKVCIHVFPLHSFKVVSLEPKSWQKTNQLHKLLLKAIIGSKHVNLINQYLAYRPYTEYVIPVTSSPEGSFITAWIGAL